MSLCLYRPLPGASNSLLTLCLCAFTLLLSAPTLHAAVGQYIDSRARSCANPADANDIMVPVGDLCVDKYEASVWSAPDGGTQYGVDGVLDYPCGNGMTGTGQTCAAAGTRIYARSVAGVKPSVTLTWLQANIACANSGKHLLTKLSGRPRRPARRTRALSGG